MKEKTRRYWWLGNVMCLCVCVCNLTKSLSSHTPAPSSPRPLRSYNILNSLINIYTCNLHLLAKHTSVCMLLFFSLFLIPLTRPCPMAWELLCLLTWKVINYRRLIMGTASVIDVCKGSCSSGPEYNEK